MTGGRVGARLNESSDDKLSPVERGLARAKENFRRSPARRLLPRLGRV